MMARRQTPLLGHLPDRIIGQSPAIQHLCAQIRQLAPFDAPGHDLVPTILLHGETGTGKGLIAQVIHESGPRARGPFIGINCAALPELLLEGELFGFAAGAFTDAKRAKPGLLETAAGGTLFLDEIDALPLALQGKLLTALEAKRVRRLGEVKERSIDLKLIAATQAELGVRAREGRFRADLYYRLAVIVVVLPPLRERRDDVVLLAQHFLQHYTAAYGLDRKRLSPAAEAWLRRHPWPGNVRELGHLLERVMLLRSERTITPEILEQLSLERSSMVAGGERAPGPAGPADEAARIHQALQHTGGNVLQAARVLGLTRKAMRYRMRRHGIERPRLPTMSPSQPARGDAEAIAPADPWSSQGAEASKAQGHTPLKEPGAAAPEWEQKSTAVLAIEITWPEQAANVVRADDPWAAAAHWETLIVETLEKFGGVILQRSPSLLTAAFGTPRALEHMPQRAVQAALALRHLIAEAQASAEQASVPTVRQAIHWGQVLVETGAGEHAARLLPIGEALACPVRLLGQAAPSEILLSLPLARLVEGWRELEWHPRPLAASHMVKLI
jgi:DNA-binding NtrC family response regulator/class 3 adenylate cyclase